MNNGEWSSKAVPSMENPPTASSFESQVPLSCADWHPLGRIVILSYREDYTNRIMLINAIQNTAGDLDLFETGHALVPYPPTRVSWDPLGSLRLASLHQCLQIWDGSEEEPIESASLINSKLPLDLLPPLTAFDWCHADPAQVITSSIDTTCTVWDLNRRSVKTQLIAHDSEVFDVKFISDSAHTFLSVGADGLLRLFDLRSLEHSTIIYEPPMTPRCPLLRLETCPVNQHLVAVIAKDSPNVLLMDLRYPGAPYLVLAAHKGAINSIKWHPTKQVLLSGADDCQALVWDLSNETRNQHVSQGEFEWCQGANMNSTVILCPDYAYSGLQEVDNVSWSPGGDWIGVVAGKTFQAVRTS